MRSASLILSKFSIKYLDILLIVSFNDSWICVIHLPYKNGLNIHRKDSKLDHQHSSRYLISVCYVQIWVLRSKKKCTCRFFTITTLKLLHNTNIYLTHKIWLLLIEFNNLAYNSKINPWIQTAAFMTYNTSLRTADNRHTAAQCFANDLLNIQLAHARLLSPKTPKFFIRTSIFQAAWYKIKIASDWRMWVNGLSLNARPVCCDRKKTFRKKVDWFTGIRCFATEC